MKEVSGRKMAAGEIMHKKFAKISFQFRLVFRFVKVYDGYKFKIKVPLPAFFKKSRKYPKKLH